MREDHRERKQEQVQQSRLKSCVIDGLRRCETLSQGNIKRLVQKLTRSLTRGIAFLFLRSGMLSMLYRAPPILEKKHSLAAIILATAVN